MILAHDEPHLGRRAAPACASHPLQKARDRKRRVDLKGALQSADVDSQLQRRRGADTHQRAVILHLLLGALAVGSREVAVMDQKAVGLAVCFAVLPQMLADRLAFLAGIRKDQAFFAARVLKDIAHPGVGCLWGGIGRRFFRRSLQERLLALVSLRRGGEEMLHREPPDLSAAVKPRDDRAPVAACCEEFSRQRGVADSRGQSDAARTAGGETAQPLDQTEGLAPSVGAQQRMDLIDHDEAQVAEQGGYLHVLVDHQRFQRLGRDLQDAPGLFQQAALLRLRDVAVPARHGNARLLAQLGEPAELVVDQRLERRDIQHADRPRRVLIQQAEDRKERRFGFAGGGGRRQQDVVFGVKDRVARRVLDRAHALPARAVDKILNEGRVSVEYFHRFSLYTVNSI